MVISFRAISLVVPLPTSAIITTRLMPQMLSTGALLAVLRMIARVVASVSLARIMRLRIRMRISALASRGQKRTNRWETLITNT